MIYLLRIDLRLQIKKSWWIVWTNCFRKIWLNLAVFRKNFVQFHRQWRQKTRYFKPIFAQIEVIFHLKRFPFDKKPLKNILFLEQSFFYPAYSDINGFFDIVINFCYEKANGLYCRCFIFFWNFSRNHGQVCFYFKPQKSKVSLKLNWGPSLCF